MLSMSDMKQFEEHCAHNSYSGFIFHLAVFSLPCRGVVTLGQIQINYLFKSLFQGNLENRIHVYDTYLIINA